MNLLFIHQNFPGQYLRLVQHLRNTDKHNIVCLGDAANIRQRGAIPGVITYGYPSPPSANSQTHHYLQTTEAAVRRGQTVARALLELRQNGFMPDVISVHPGWGEALFVRDIFPHTPVLMFCEYFFRAYEADLNFDPEFPASHDLSFSVRIRNTPQIISLMTANACIAPTAWQASRYPAAVRQRIQIIHDGIDAAYMSPCPEAVLELLPGSSPGESRVGRHDLALNALLHCCPAPSSATVLPRAAAVPDMDDHEREEPAPWKKACSQTVPSPTPALLLTRRDKVITYIARNLEPYRGIHVFLRALPELQRRHPDAHILIAGNNGASYSPPLPVGQSYKARYLAELGDALDLSRIHFLGRVSYSVLRAMFRISSAHVYLTYPFVLSWSMLEAMACECLLIASDTEPVREVVRHNDNGLLVNFFDTTALVSSLDAALSAPEKYSHLRQSARRTVLRHFELGACLEKQSTLLQALADNTFPIPD